MAAVRAVFIRYRLPLIVMILLLGTFFGITQSAFYFFRLDAADNFLEANLALIKSSHTKLFLTLSSFEAILSVLKSAKFGISFILDYEMQIGNFVTSFDHLVYQSWLVSLGALLFIEGLHLLYSFLDQIFFCMVGVYGMVLLTKYMLYDVLKMKELFFLTYFHRWLNIASIFIFILFPVYILIFAGCHKATESAKSGFYEKVVHEHESIKFSSKHELNKKMDGLFSKDGDIHQTMKEKTHSFFEKMLTYTAVVLFEIIVLPIGFFIWCWSLLKNMANSRSFPSPSESQPSSSR